MSPLLYQLSYTATCAGRTWPDAQSEKLIPCRLAFAQFPGGHAGAAIPWIPLTADVAVIPDEDKESRPRTYRGRTAASIDRTPAQARVERAGPCQGTLGRRNVGHRWHTHA